MGTVWLEVVFVLCAHFGGVWAHGHLVVPPARSSLWRYGFDSPRNYDDNGLNCGGFGVQYDQNGGRCGVCGDPAHVSPRPNEAGGKYANGIIARQYESGNRINVEVLITANHQGYFEFRLCPHNNPQLPVSQTCLDQFPLLIWDTSSGATTRFMVPRGARTITLSVQLPSGLTCSQCVLQWTYTAGNNYGCDSTGCGVGKGRQEKFINCADIAIRPVGTVFITTHPATARPNTPQPPIGSVITAVPPRTARPNTALHGATAAPNYNPILTNPVSRQCGVNGQGLWGLVPGMDVWCRNNCALGFCPESHCSCNK